MGRPCPTRDGSAMGAKSHLQDYKRSFQCFRQEIFLQNLGRRVTAKNTTSVLKMRFRIARFRVTILLALRKKHTCSDSAFVITFRREEWEAPSK